ncbi:MAG: FHA domain-containing protein, partial [Ignavibacteriaceae bacterium]
MSDTKISDAFNPDAKIIKVKILKGNTLKKEYYFDNSFSIGRAENCSIQINEGIVSRFHIEVCYENNKWRIIDKQSSNGTFLNGEKIDKVEIKNTTTVELGKNGPIVLFTFENQKKSLPQGNTITPDTGSVT